MRTILKFFFFFRELVGGGGGGGAEWFEMAISLDQFQIKE